MIKVGDKIPSATLTIMSSEGPRQISTDELFAGKKIVLFAVPGAFTPTCSNAHLPGYVEMADDILAKGVDSIVCLSVNDAFVMDAWGRDQKVGEQILMVADGNADLTRALGLETDLGVAGLGIRSQRYAMVVEDSVVTLLEVEKPKTFELSSAEAILEKL